MKSSVFILVMALAGFMTAANFLNAAAPNKFRIELKSPLKPIVTIEMQGQYYLAKVDYLQIKGFPEGITKRLSFSKGRSYIYLALNQYLKVRKGYYLSIEQPNVLVRETKGARFFLSMKFAKRHVSIRKIPPKTAGNPEPGHQPNGGLPEIGGNLFTKKGAIADYIRAFYEEVNRELSGRKLPFDQFYDSIPGIQKDAKSFYSVMLKTINGEKLLVAFERRELKQQLDNNEAALKAKIKQSLEAYLDDEKPNPKE
jgi:hypothetical protein